MTRPLTEAGRAHLGALVGLGVCAEDGEGLRDILAIEAEARAAALAEVGHIRAIASGEGGYTASRSDPWNALATIVIVCDRLLGAPAPSEPGLREVQSRMHKGRWDDLGGAPSEPDR